MEAKKPKTDFPSEGIHSEETYQHVLAEGEDDYDDYTDQELNMFPELGFGESEVEEVVKELSPALKKSTEN